MANTFKSIPLWSYGFRPFFLVAAIFSVVSIAAWVMMLEGVLQMPSAGVAPTQWHAHEMLFGYAMAIIAGFLLTAVRNWTQLPTLQDRPLALLVLCWSVSRVLYFVPDNAATLFAGLFDLVFMAVLVTAIARPIFVTKQTRRQSGIIAKLVLIGLSQLAFIIGLLSDEPGWMSASLYSALYLIVALCLGLARRLIPFFVKAGTQLELPNSDILDRASLVVFLVFWMLVITFGHGSSSAVLAGLLFLIHGARLWLWRSVEVLRSPLLWVLYVAYAFFLLGFLLLALMPMVEVSLSAATHAFTVGGIGTLTIGMMSRVAWGHTGRNLQHPPRTLPLIFASVLLAAVLRVAGPLLWPGFYTGWILLSGIAWIAAFVIFLGSYFPVLIGPRKMA